MHVLLCELMHLLHGAIFFFFTRSCSYWETCISSTLGSYWNRNLKLSDLKGPFQREDLLAPG